MDISISEYSPSSLLLAEKEALYIDMLILHGVIVSWLHCWTLQIFS